MKISNIALSVSATMFLLSAHAGTPACPPGTSTCNIVSPELGDTDQSANGSSSKADQNNVSSNTNTSGTTISPDNKDVNNNSNDGSITGGNTTSTGGTTSSNGGTYTTGNLQGGTGGSVGNLTTGPSTSSNGSNSNGGEQSFKGSQSSKNDSSASNGDQSFNAGTTSNSNANGQGQGQSSDNSNILGQNSTNGQGQSSTNNITSSDDKKQNTSVNTNDDRSQSFDAGTTTNTSNQGLDNQNKVTGTNKNGDVSGRQDTSVNTSDDRRQGQSLSDVGNSASGSNSSNSMGKSGNSQTNVDASDKSVSTYEANTLIRAPINHGGTINLSSPGNISSSATSCGPYVYSYDVRAVTGTVVGFFGGTKSVPLGYETRVKSMTDVNGKPYNFLYELAPNGDTMIIGSQVLVNATGLQVAAAKSISFGASRALGEDAQVGANNSSGMGQLVLNHTVVPCVYGVIPREANKPLTPHERKNMRRVGDISLQQNLGGENVDIHYTNGIK